MARIKIDLPERFDFTIEIPVRITDINYGGHVGNDTILSILHEARARFFKHHFYDELNLAGAGTILSDVAIEFKNELFYGDIILASVTAAGFTKVAFELYYKLERKTPEGKLLLAAVAKTGVVTYDYSQKKIVPVPAEVPGKLMSR
jgi:acyl-CoA thioester hydrolase